MHLHSLSPVADQLMVHKFLHEIPMLKVITAHYILRNNLPYNQKNLSKQLNDFLEEVKVGAWGTMPNINLKESRKAQKLIFGSIEPEFDGILRISLTILLTDNLTRELSFPFNTQADSTGRVVKEMILHGLLCPSDRKAMEKLINESLQQYYSTLENL